MTRLCNFYDKLLKTEKKNRFNNKWINSVFPVHIKIKKVLNPFGKKYLCGNSITLSKSEAKPMSEHMEKNNA